LVIAIVKVLDAEVHAVHGRPARHLVVQGHRVGDQLGKLEEEVELVSETVLQSVVEEEEEQVRPVRYSLTVTRPGITDNSRFPGIHKVFRDDLGEPESQL